MVVGNSAKLKSKLIKVYHDSAMGGHSGVLVTGRRLAIVVYWKGLWKAVREYVRHCNVCQQNKYENVALPGTLQPSLVPKGIFTDILDFIGLPKSQRKSAIFVVVDRLTKYTHFMALPHLYTAKSVAQTFVDNIYKLHGLPEVIVSDRDVVFTSNFWQEIFKSQGVSLHVSTARHPQTNGQTEVVNRCLEAYLSCMCGSMPSSWSEWLSMAVSNKSLSLSTYEKEMLATLLAIKQ